MNADRRQGMGRPFAVPKPILVTGSHRSGTTWLGRIIASAPRVAYIHEPFSVTDPPGPGICNVRFTRWFTYITSENEASYYVSLKHTVALKYNFFAAARSARSYAELNRIIKEQKRFLTYRMCGYTALIKDPLAFFSAPWMVQRFDMQPIVLIRHPAAFVSSVLKLGWRHPFAHFLEQQLLLEQVLSPFEAVIRAYAAHEPPIIDQAILLWRIMHDTILDYQRHHSDWLFLRHEDVSADPIPAVQRVFQHLNLVYDQGVEAFIHDYSGATNPADPNAPVGSEQTLRRDSRLNLANWKHRLTPAQITKIRRDVEDVSSFFYADHEW